MYLVTIDSGEYDDYRSDPHFVTQNEEDAKAWCKRYNKIVKEAFPRHVEYYNAFHESVRQQQQLMAVNKGHKMKYLKSPYMYNDVYWLRSEAAYQKVEVR